MPPPGTDSRPERYGVFRAASGAMETMLPSDWPASWICAGSMSAAWPVPSDRLGRMCASQRRSDSAWRRLSRLVSRLVRLMK